MGFDGGQLGVVDWWLGCFVDFNGGRLWVLILILKLMGFDFDFDYDFFRLIGYVVVVGGWVCSGWWWLGLWW